MSVCVKDRSEMTVKDTIADCFDYLKVDYRDFNLKNCPMFKDNPGDLVSTAHLYRTMILSAAIARARQCPREGLLAFCGAFIHDMSRSCGCIGVWHGRESVKRFFPLYDLLWSKYDLSSEEREWVKAAVIKHPFDKIGKEGDPGYLVAAILKDSDVLERMRLGTFNPDDLNLPESASVMMFASKLLQLSNTESEIPDIRDFLKTVAVNDCMRYD